MAKTCSWIWTSYGGCAPGPYTGNDEVWDFQSAVGQEFWIDVFPYTTGSNPALIVESSGCGGNGTCEGLSDNPGLADESVPGLIGDGSTYSIQLDDSTSASSVEYIVQVGCPVPCDPALDVFDTITCSEDVISGTTATGSNVMDYFGACPNTTWGALVESNQEVIYEFTPQVTGDITVWIDNMTTNHNLYVLDDTCDDASSTRERRLPFVD